MLTKLKVDKQIKDLPEEFSIDDLVEKLILVEKIEKGLEQSNNGKVVSEDELDKETEQWFK